MPYIRQRQLPVAVKRAFRDVPHAKSVYENAYNSAYTQYANAAKRHTNKSREETAHAVAWGAVKRQYRKGPDGRWHPLEKSE